MDDLKSLDSLFKEKIFRIPDYQRGYAWQHDQLKDFWEDLINLPGNRSQRWLRLFGQFLSVHKWCLAACAYAAVGRAG